jgi:cytochrome c biogenesis protein CcdA
MIGVSIVAVVMSFVAGIASFLSPCVPPLVPGYDPSPIYPQPYKGEDGDYVPSSRLNSV